MVRTGRGVLDFALRRVRIEVPSESSENVVFAG